MLLLLYGKGSYGQRPALFLTTHLTGLEGTCCPAATLSASHRRGSSPMAESSLQSSHFLSWMSLEQQHPPQAAHALSLGQPRSVASLPANPLVNIWLPSPPLLPNVNADGLSLVFLLAVCTPRLGCLGPHFLHDLQSPTPTCTSYDYRVLVSMLSTMFSLSHTIH